MQKNQDDTDIIEKEDKKGHWVGDHWVINKSGYCKSDDGPCENVVDKRGRLFNNFTRFQS